MVDVLDRNLKPSEVFHASISHSFWIKLYIVTCTKSTKRNNKDSYNLYGCLHRKWLRDSAPKRTKLKNKIIIVIG